MLKMTREAISPAEAVGTLVPLFLGLWRLRNRTRKLKRNSSTPPGSRKKPHLVLHFDVNETIMVGDPAGGDTFEDCLNKIICKNAYVRTPEAGKLPTHWYDGTRIIEGGNAPPLHFGWMWPTGSKPFYECRVGKELEKKFTELAGAPYRKIFLDLKNACRWEDDDVTKDKSLCHDGKHHFLLPAFFTTIAELAKRGRSFTIVIRTFGTDANDVVEAINAFAEGRHLGVFGRGVPEIAVKSDDVWSGAYSSEGTFTLQRKCSQTGEYVKVTDEDEVVDILEGRIRDEEGTTPAQIRCVVCTDDYKYWKSKDEIPSAGKPMWITGSDNSVHQIFFDDNIKPIIDKSIVAIRYRKAKGLPFSPLSGQETIDMHGSSIVRVPTACPILDPLWFVKQIDTCEKNECKMSLFK